MPTSTFTHELFGQVTFKTKHDFWFYGDAITFTAGFDVNDITQVTIPQLKNVPGSNGGKLGFHKRGHDQLIQAFADIEKMGLLHFVKTCAGSVNFCLRKPVNGHLSMLPSNHAFGIAIDLNSDDKALGASVAPVAPVFEAHGFRWGQAFKDPMHFEVREFLASPKPLAAPLMKAMEMN